MERAKLVRDVTKGMTISSLEVRSEGFCLLATEDMKAGDWFTWNQFGQARKVVTDGDRDSSL